MNSRQKAIIALYDLVVGFSDNKPIKVDGTEFTSLVEADILAQIAIFDMLDIFMIFQSLTDSYIQSKINEYNLANNTTYQNIDSFTKYTYDANLPRYAVAKSFLDFSNAIWNKVEDIRDAFLLSTKYNATWVNIEPTEEEFLAELATVVRV